MLEDRQNEMKELWRSDTDDENDDKKSDNEKPVSNNIDENQPKSVPCNIDDKHRDSEVDQPNDVTDATADGMKSIDDESIPNDKEVNADVTPEDSDKLFDDVNQSFIEETKLYNEKQKARNQDLESTDNVVEEQDSENNMTLVFDDSKTSETDENIVDMNNADVGETNKEAGSAINEGSVKSTISDQNKNHNAMDSTKNNTEVDSQLISLHFDTENDDTEKLDSEDMLAKIAEGIEKPGIDGMEVDAFSDDDLNMDDIDNIIENADIIRGKHKCRGASYCCTNQNSCHGCRKRF